MHTVALCFGLDFPHQQRQRNGIERIGEGTQVIRGAGVTFSRYGREKDIKTIYISPMLH